MPRSMLKSTGSFALPAAVIASMAAAPATAQEDTPEKGDTLEMQDALEDAPELQHPEGWEVRFDDAGADMDDLHLVAMPPGLHVTTGPSLIAYHPDSVAAGDFRVESETHLFDPEGRREAFGIFVGGGDLQGPDQRYTYFMVREGGEFLVKTRSGTSTAVVHDWTRHPAIVSFTAKPEDAGTARNVIVLEADGDELRFFVNGEQVWSGPRGTLATDGVFGLRVNHGLDLHVTTILSEALPGGSGPVG